MGTSQPDQLPEPVDARERWAVTTGFGLGLVGVTLLVSSAHLLVVGALAGPVLVLPVIGTVCLAAGLLARRGTRAALVTALVVAVLVLAGNLGHLVDTLGLPASPWDFIPNLAALLGLLVAIPASVAGLRDASTTDAVHRWVRVAAAAVLVVGAMSSIALSFVDTQALPSDALAVVTEANAYDPEVIEVARGSVLGLRNHDAYGHTFTVVDLGIDIGLPGHATATVEIEPGTPLGTYEVTCVLHPEIMIATLDVASP